MSYLVIVVKLEVIMLVGAIRGAVGGGTYRRHPTILAAMLRSILLALFSRSFVSLTYPRAQRDIAQPSRSYCVDHNRWTFCPRYGHSYGMNRLAQETLWLHIEENVDGPSLSSFLHC